METLQSKYTTPLSKDIFDLDAWYDEFFQNEDASVLDHMDVTSLIELAAMDQKLLENHFQNGTLYDEVSDACRGLGGMLMLVRMRTLHLDFRCTEGVCAFIVQLSQTSAQGVMYSVAFAMAWDNREPDMIYKLLGGDDIFKDIPTMNWVLNMYNNGFACGPRDNPLWIQSNSWGIPSQDHLHKMWEKQKMIGAARGILKCGSDNWLDTVEFDSGKEDANA